MTQKNRDDFRQSTKTTLSQRTGGLCSNPDCMAPTSAPCGSEKVTSIGIAAHIHAAAPGGKRYLAEMTPEERFHINNGVWLCSNCSIMIDRDVGIFSAEKLREWKAMAEKRAMDVLGKRPNSSEETLDKLIQALDQRKPKLSLSQAIARAHRDQEKFLEGLDHRFAVISHQADGRPYIEIRAKETVNVQFKVRTKTGDGYAEGFRDLFDHGKKLEIDLLDASFEGSDLLSHLLTEDAKDGGKIIFNPSTRRLSARIELINPKTHLIDHVAEVTGETTAGEKSMRFEGKTFDGLITVGFGKNFVEDESPPSITLHLGLDQWEKRSLRTLPYLSQVARLYQRLADGWELSLILEHKGEVIFTGTGNFQACADAIHVLNTYLIYTLRARSVSMLLQEQVFFTKDVAFSNQELTDLEDIRLMLENQGQVPKENLKKPITVDVIYDDTIDQFGILGGNTSGTMRFIENEGGAVAIFGQLIRLPRKVMLVEGFIPQVKQKKGKWINGDTIKLTLKPVEGYAVTLLYDQGIGNQ